MLRAHPLLLTFLLTSLPLAQPSTRQQQSTRASQTNPTETIYRCLFLRDTSQANNIGAENLDLEYWIETKHLLTGASHEQAKTCLDDFINAHREKDIRDSTTRAVLQHDLWALFDWSARGIDHPRERRELQVRLAEVLRRLAQDDRTTASLPDNFADTVKSGAYPAAYDPANPSRAFLPPDLLRQGGHWVCINSSSTALTVPIHVEAFGGRSRFLVLMNLPGGREATFRYLHQLYNFAGQLLIRDTKPGPQLNLDLPQFPAGTQVALVRQMILFDRDRKLIVTPITESIQIRVYHSITRGSPYMNNIGGPSAHDQDFFEFRLDKKRILLGGSAVLKAVGNEEKEVSTFMSHGFDAYEMRGRGESGPITNAGRIMDRCHACHSDWGIHSVQSRFSLVPPNDEQDDTKNGDPNYGAVFWETEKSLNWKRNRYDWGLLNGYWNASQR